MANQAHCAYAFECLAANFEHRQPLALAQVEQLWEQYHKGDKDDEDLTDGIDGDLDGDSAADDETTDMTDAEDASQTQAPPSNARPAAISRLLNRASGGGSGSSSQTSLPSSARSTTSSTPSGSSEADTPATSRSSLFSFGRRRRDQHEEQKYPLFVTWNVVNRSGYKTLRGCIGTFEAQELEYGLRSYALTRYVLKTAETSEDGKLTEGSAFEDVRFPPIPPSLLSNLSNHVTLLHSFSQPTTDPLDWTLGTHGIRISFSVHGRRYGATYLPDVAREQGWTKEETLVSLMRKAGWNGGSSAWLRTWRDGRGELVRYEGKAVGLHYREWKEWREWAVEKAGALGKPLN